MSAKDKYASLLDKVKGMDLGGGGFWKPREGRSKIRILPPVGDMEFFFQEVGRHYKQRQFCPALTTEGKKPCPICELNERLFQAGEKEAASDFRANRAFWMNIVDRSNEDKGPQVYTPGIRVFQALVALIGDPDYGNITDEEDGFDIKITRSGQGLDTEYVLMPGVRASPLTDDEELMDEWLELAEDLNERVMDQLLDYDELKEKAGIQAYDDDDDDEEDEAPIVTRTRRRTRRGKK